MKKKGEKEDIGIVEVGDFWWNLESVIRNGRGKSKGRFRVLGVTRGKSGLFYVIREKRGGGT